MKENKLLLIANPKAGTGKINSALMKVVSTLSSGGYEVTVYPTKRALDAMKKVEECGAEYGTVVVCGGDGTLNEVVNGAVSRGIDTKIGYIPAGTLNEWSSGLKISRNIEKAAADIVNGRVTPLDVGRFMDRYFTYTASFGAFTEASYSAPQEIKNILGQAAYFFEGIKSIANIKSRRLTVETEIKTIEGDFLFGAVSNSHSLGGVLKIKENLVDLNDGFFEVLLIRRPDTVAELQQIVDGLLKKDFNRAGLEFFRAAKIKITSAEPFDWTLDGEHARGKKETYIENLPHRLNFIVPK